MSIPIIAFCIFDAIYGIVDMVWVSQIGVEAFFAMGRHGYIATLLFIVTGVMLFYIKMVLKKLENKDITIGE